MSGIVALLQHNGAPVDGDLLARMTAAQRFRGPHGEGLWAEGPIGLGHTLHVATLQSDGEVQPISLDGQVHLTADARIDAREQLCAELLARGIDARADATDAELILRAYAAWGTACVEHLLGDYAFVLWDRPNRRLLCAVDQLGTKPLHFVERGGLFAAANSLECLRLHPAVRDTLDDVAVADFLLWGSYLDRDVTIYADVRRLSPGHRLVLESGHTRLERYFELPEPRHRRFASDEDCVAEFRSLFDAAVRDRLRTPRVAIELSGGLDSPLVAESAKRQLAEQYGDRHELLALTAVYDHLIPDDERRYAGLVGEHLHLPMRFVQLDDAPLFGDTARQRLAAPEPTAEGGTSPWTAALYEVAARCPVLLTGFDGDALLLAQTPRHWALRARERHWRDLGHELAWYVRSQRGLPPMGVRNALKAWRQRRSAPVLPSWLRPDFVARLELTARHARELTPAKPDHPRAPSRTNLLDPAWGGLFTSQDAGHFGVPLETRNPLADLRVVRFALELPAVPWCIHKELLRRAAAGRLPEAVRRRPKTPLQRPAAIARFEQHGLGLAPERWASEALSPYVDVPALRRALAQPPAPAEFYIARNAVALGLWLAAPREPKEPTLAVFNQPPPC